ncbi:MAG: matrixin family metalloprotease [Spirochaetales bacterium]|nr:matrixin family metalloprotease [Spirochaetales bacterium]
MHLKSKQNAYLIFLLLPLFFLPACGKDDSVVNRVQENSVHRRAENIIEYYLNTEANELTETAVQTAFDNWQRISHFTFVYKGRNRAGIRKDGKNTVSFLTRWPREVAVTKIAWCQNWYDDKDNIIESDIILNMTLTKFTTLHTNSKNAYYIEGVLIHEIGHMIGLDHIESDTSVMKKKSSKEESFFKGVIDGETISAYETLYNFK